MEWQPIETYDALKVKPLHAVFWVKESRNNRSSNYLYAQPVLERRFGFREVTHWMPLPEAPK